MSSELRSSTLRSLIQSEHIEVLELAAGGQAKPRDMCLLLCQGCKATCFTIGGARVVLGLQKLRAQSKRRAMQDVPSLSNFGRSDVENEIQ